MHGAMCYHHSMHVQHRVDDRQGRHAVGGQHSRFERLALSKLKWMVVRDMVEMESACWWYQSPEVERGEIKIEGGL